MSFDYFYGQQSDLFTFYRVPKVLFTNERFWNISADAKMLYGILLDRMSLSAKNGWIDKNGRVYIIFTIDEAKMALNCAEQKAIKLLSELEKKAGLIERKRQGLGKPNLIYVKNFISAVDSQLLNCENHNSGTMEITTQELPKSQCNNTDIKNTEFSDTDSIFPSGNGGMMDENDRYQEYFDYFSDQLSIDLLKKDYPYDSEMLDNILELIVETVCTKRPLIRIGAEERPAEIVRSRFMKLNVEHKDNADTIIGNMDSRIFLGGSEPTTLKELNQALGKETIDTYNTSNTRGNSPSYGLNYQKLGKDLASVDELAVLDGSKCILQLRGVRPFLSDKYDLTQHPNYKYTSDFDKRNEFNIEQFLSRRLKLKAGDEFVVVDAD